MRPARVSLGSALALVGSILLLVSLFLSWYEPGLSAWTIFETMDLVLAAIAIATIGAAAADSGLASPLRPQWLPRLAALALVIVVAALINHPPAALGRPPATGIWIALAGSLLMLVGGLLTVARVSLAVNVVIGHADSERKAQPPGGAAAGAPSDPATQRTADLGEAPTSPQATPPPPASGLAEAGTEPPRKAPD